MNWENVQLSDNYERDQNILEPYNFDTLLLEINCNIKTENLNAEEITKHFNNIINARVREAKEIFKSNLKNIVKQAQTERAKK